MCLLKEISRASIDTQLNLYTYGLALALLYLAQLARWAFAPILLAACDACASGLQQESIGLLLLKIQMLLLVCVTPC